MQYYIWYRSPSSRREYNSYSTSAHWTMGKPGYRRTLPHSTPTGANEGCLATMAYCFTSILWGESCVAWWMAEIALDFLKVFGEDRSCPSWAHCSEVSIYIGCKIYQAHSAVSNFWVLKRWFLAKRGCSKKNGENVKNAGKKNSNCIYQPLFTRCKIQCQKLDATKIALSDWINQSDNILIINLSSSMDRFPEWADYEVLSLILFFLKIRGWMCLSNFKTL